MGIRETDSFSVVVYILEICTTIGDCVLCVNYLQVQILLLLNAIVT